MAVSGSARSIDLLLIDDHVVIRHALRVLIESALGHRVVEAEDSGDGLDVLRSRSVDLVLVDARLDGQDGLGFLRLARGLRPDIPVVLLSTYETTDWVRAALEAGAAGYVSKDSSFEQLREAIDVAVSGRGTYLSPILAQRLWSGSARASAANRAELSDRELEVLAELVRGARNDQIARNLYVSVKTVKSHLGSIFRKLDVTNRTEAASKAIREGLVPLPGDRAEAV